MALVALLSNPRSTGNKSLLPEVRSFCADHADIFHYEVEQVDQIAKALETIARVKPRVLVINGGDGTVQAALTELHQGGHFGDTPPPVAVLPNGKTNLIALDLGATGSALAALENILAIARGGDLESHIVVRQMIALSKRIARDAGARHVPGRRGPRRIHSLLPPQDIPARAAQRAQPFPCRTGGFHLAVVQGQFRFSAAPLDADADFANPRRRSAGQLCAADRHHARTAAACGPPVGGLVRDQGPDEIPRR